ncbi:MAG: FAD-dependent oxidoreductase [Alphaproteobacteria bacterium]|nr:FAD-dependent oxidoreductase [Alphaproteobacteria bacterium]
MSDEILNCDVAVVGAGLSGLACAHLLREAGLNTIVLEAADRVGGRIHSVTHSTTGVYVADLGPTWVWPPYQPSVTAWLKRLNVDTFEQFEDGDGILDMDENAPVQRQPLPGQYGIRRISGGPQALINRLHASLAKDMLRTGHRATAIKAGGTALKITTNGPDIRSLTANRVVIAVPPRLAAQNIAWLGCLDHKVLTALTQTPTWMGAQAKAVMLYEQPFWRAKGLSGRVASRIGPLAEIHDHCSPDVKESALFGFIGWPHSARQSHPSALRDAIERQLVRCFSKEGSAYSALHIEDWACNPNACSDLDLTQPPSHPELTPGILREAHYEGRLFFSVAETAMQSPGLIDGALSVATDTAARLIEGWPHPPNYGGK